MNEDEHLITQMIDTYTDGFRQEGTFLLTRGDFHVVVTRSEPPTMAGVPLWNVSWFLVEDGAIARQADFMVDVPRQAVLPTLDAIVPPVTITSTVTIPGVVHAEYRDGRILKIVFLPHGSNAGWSGPSAELFDGDPDLDVEETDGPFWKAVQRYLSSMGHEAESIRWEE